MRLIESKYDLGQIIYLKTDCDQKERMVIQICLNGMGLQYQLSSGNTFSWHFEYEITEEKNVLISTTS